MKNFYTILAVAILATGCAGSEPCTPSQTLEDGTVIHGPTDSGIRHVDGYGKPAEECSNRGEIYWNWPEYKAWETSNIKNNINSGIYNFKISSYHDQEEQILNDYEFQSPDYENSEVFYDAANAPTTEAEFAIVRGPSFRAVEESCNEELNKSDAGLYKTHLEDVPTGLELIRGAENMTLAEAEAERDKLMFRGDNWFWPSSESKCANVEENQTLRSKIRSSEKKSEIGKNTQCPGMKMFSEISDDDNYNRLISDSYTTPRSEYTDHVDLSNYPAELDNCRQVCFVNKNVITGHRYIRTGNSLSVEAVYEDKILSVKPPYKREGFSLSIYNPGRYDKLKDEFYLSFEQYEKFQQSDEYLNLFRYNSSDTYKIRYVNTGVYIGKQDIYYLADEEQRIACTKCETQQYAQMCRFPKNEIFVVRKK